MFNNAQHMHNTMLENIVRFLARCLNTQNNDIQHNNTQHNYTQHNNKTSQSTLTKDTTAALSIMTLDADCCYAEFYYA